MTSRVFSAIHCLFTPIQINKLQDKGKTALGTIDPHSSPPPLAFGLQA